MTLLAQNRKHETKLTLLLRALRQKFRHLISLLSLIIFQLQNMKFLQNRCQYECLILA